MAATVRDTVRDATAKLTAAGCETPRLDAELLVAHALGLDRGVLLAHPETELSGSAERAASELLARRAEREPVAYLVGRKGFRRIELAIDRRAYVPRPETELLVEVALELPRGASVHEVGTGSGTVALALADERPDLAISASDASPDALALARENAERLGLSVTLTLAQDLPPEAHGVDLVLANLPYVAEDEWPDLAPELTRWEPRSAAVPGPTGLEAIEAVVGSTPAGKPIALEHAWNQGAAVRALLDDAETRPDLAGHERVTVGRVASEAHGR